MKIVVGADDEGQIADTVVEECANAATR